MCNNWYIVWLEWIKIHCSFPQRILRCNFSLKLFRWAFTKHILKCFAVVGSTHPCQTKCRLTTELSSSQPAAPALKVLPPGAQTHPNTCTERGVLQEHCGDRKATTDPELPWACSVTAVWRPLWVPPHLGNCAERGCLGHSWSESGFTLPHRLRFLVITSCWGRGVPL